LAQFGRYRERHDRLTEAITLIRQLWSGQRVSFCGRYFQTEQLRLYDLPTQLPPIDVSAGAEKRHPCRPIRRRMDHRWRANVDPQLRTAFEQGARAAGKDPARMPTFVGSFVVMGDGSDVNYAAQRWWFLAAPPSTRSTTPL
jgi:alkanesulfonate monooxygenase SsuD/methylene tetrahydromethanopterin reductase-like flavin-dependent oxidoreductase (luciferase family)